MQREIKYRGQRTDTKEWVYGSLIHVPQSGNGFITVIVKDDASVYSPHRDFGYRPLVVIPEFWYKVIPETVGQYTGLNDKNGKEIYEGDVIPYHFNQRTVGVVKYGEYHNPFDSDNHGGHVGFYLEWNNPDSLLRVDLGYWIKVSEVIGNSYSNPEPLTQPSIDK